MTPARALPAFLRPHTRSSFSRKRESSFFRTALDPRFRGGDGECEFHLVWRGMGP
jgi:hypothetical protein